MVMCECPLGPSQGPTLSTTCGGGAFMLFMGLLEVFLRSQCDLEDPCRRPMSTRNLQQTYDFVIVGSGSGGSVVASRLTENPDVSVLLIEAGSNEPIGTQIPSMFLNFLGSSIDWGYKTEPERNACLSSEDKRCYWPRGKVLGGTSVINGMMYIRGNKEDYDHWEELGNPGWRYEKVLPYFMKSEDNSDYKEMDPKYHTTGGLLPVGKFPYHPPFSKAILRAGEELGYTVQDLNSYNSTGFMIAQSNHKNGVRMSTSRAYLRPAIDRPNLHIILNTTVAKVLIGQNKVAQGVEIIDSDGFYKKIYAKKEVIISGGAVNSPQLLQLSGIGDPNELKQAGVYPIVDLPGVGKNLHNHVAFFVNFKINDVDSTPLNWATAMEYLLFRDGLMSGTGVSATTAKIASQYASHPDQPDLQFYFGGYLAGCAKTGQVGELASNGSRSIQVFPAVLHPKSRGYITLASNNPLDHPKIYANYLADDHDVKVLVEGIKFAIAMSKTKALQAYGMTLDMKPLKACKMYKFLSDEYWECAVRYDTGPENHQAGSCKMGPSSDPLAVVDHDLRVHGVRNLRVVDASIMPKVTSGNTNAPVIMIAEIAADRIKTAWGLS